jgi:hypothetical protein
MTTLTSLARAVATEAGRAQPIRTVRHVHISDRPLVFIPLALAGEANAPLAAMVGVRDEPAVLVVPEPRDRTERFDFAGRLADVILPFITSFDASEDAPQILVPNPSGVAFARLLGRSTRFRRTVGEYAVRTSVPLLGRWLSFYTERAVDPASSMLLPATGMLSEHWATGQSPAEDLNLAALLAWIDPPPGMSGAEAALRAEDPVEHPPAGPATDPSFDNEVLEGRINAVRSSKLTGRGRDHAVTALTEALTTQLAPTWDLMWRAVDLMRALSAAEHVASRWSSDVEAFAWHTNHIREGGPPQARRDGAVAAARRLANLERLQEMVSAQRAFDDPLVMAEHRMTGEAFAGVVAAAEPDRIDAGGKRRVLRPHVTVETSDEVLISPGGTLYSPARPAQEATVVEVSGGSVTLELKKGMGRSLIPEPGSVPSLSEAVCYATFNTAYQRPPAFPDREDTPWTHGGPPPEEERPPFASGKTPNDEDAREEWS